MRPLHVLGEFASGLRWDAVPVSVRRRASLAFRDSLGATIGGSSTTAGRIASSTARARGDADGPIAAFARGVAASAFDVDDGHYLGGAIHPGSVIASALVVAQRSTDTDLAGLLTAQIAGYEIALRAAHLLWPRREHDTYHCTGTAAALGAAAAVATLRCFDADVIARAIAIAWAHAPMATFQLPMVKESIGWSAATGLFAADLSAAGFMAAPGGARSAIDDTFTPTPFDRPGAMGDAFVSSIGAVFESERTYFKPYACCRYTHTAIRSLQELMHGHGIAGGDIEAIDVATHRGAINLNDVRPATLEHAQYSFPFVLGSVMHAGDATTSEICERAVADAHVLVHAAKVRVHHDPALDAHYPMHYATCLAVRCTDGSRLERTRLLAPGDVGDPMSDGALREKFVGLAAPRLGTDDASVLADRFIDPRVDVRPALAQALP